MASNSGLIIGSPIFTYVLYLKRNAPQGFVLEWFQDEAKTIPSSDVSGQTVQMIIGERNNPTQMWETVGIANITTFDITAEESDLQYRLYDGLILLVGGEDGDIPLADLRIEVNPS